MVTIKIKKCARGGLGHPPMEVGEVTFGPADLEAMALKIYMLTEDMNTDKFEYSAKLDTIKA